MTGPLVSKVIRSSLWTRCGLVVDSLWTRCRLVHAMCLQLVIVVSEYSTPCHILAHTDCIQTFSCECILYSHTKIPCDIATAVMWLATGVMWQSNCIYMATAVMWHCFWNLTCTSEYGSFSQLKNKVYPCNETLTQWEIVLVYMKT